ncbi:hypothetical protein CPC08DRAFT_653266 [Agrocybe pediades]|nr:hypothetical protein CPC08DRAFT_653266 [Agrocybe pediades]
MKYLALLSGGKDSCYNLVHCAQNGHELVAAASLGPEPGKEEIDSYLYQTVGQDAIELVARALDVPLYRRIISGNAVEQGSEYGGRSANNAGGVTGDETEDLYELLSTVKAHHPDVQGVSVGAILSNYQRVRVEHVCRRLSLTPLCFLWQRNQAELLSEMIAGGMNAILIKVAGIGLTKGHLGKSLAQMEPTLVNLNSLYGLHICGEGGEYETLTLDCPLFKQRIELLETETVIHSDSDFATVAFLRVKKARLVDKEVDPRHGRVPPLLEDRFEEVRVAVETSQSQSTSLRVTPSTEERWPGNRSRSLRKGPWLVISDVRATIPRDRSSFTLEDEVMECFDLISHQLAQNGLELAHCSFINILIASMDLFVAVNAVYSTFFGISPPARACVCVNLPEGVRVKMECIAYAERSSIDRQALHVQGLSYWAPANIGPYSQAIIAGDRVFISGQIGLIPSQLALPTPKSLGTELALACQHVDRIAVALRENAGGAWDGHTQLAIYWAVNIYDIAHIKMGHLKLQPESSQYPVLFVVVKELPKNALVEKQVILHTGRCLVVDDYDGEVSSQKCIPIYKTQEFVFQNDSAASWEYSVFEEDGSACAIIFLKGGFKRSDLALRTVTAELSSITSSALSTRCFCRSGFDIPEYFHDSVFGFQVGELPFTSISCTMISNLTRDDWDVAICIVTAPNA